MIKKTILTLTLVLSLVTPIYGDTIEPTVKYPDTTRHARERVIGDPTLLDQEVVVGHITNGYFNRYLNKNKSILKIYFDIYKSPIKQKTNYNIITFFDKNYPRLVAIYILNKQDTIVGYCLIDNMGVTKSYNLFENSPIITQMKALTLNNTYFQNSLRIPANVTVNFYEQDHGTFIERYGFMENSTYEQLTLEAFYPKELESELTVFIKNGLNANLDDFLLRKN